MKIQHTYSRHVIAATSLIIIVDEAILQKTRSSITFTNFIIYIYFNARTRSPPKSNCLTEMIIFAQNTNYAKTK